MNRRQHVLVLDIDERFLIEWERMLEDEGFDTTTTWDCRQAVELLHSRGYDLVVVGHHPPDINAEDVLTIVQEVNGAARCVVLYPSDACSGEYIRSRGVFAVKARCDPAEVLRLVEEHFAKRYEAAA